MLRLRDQTGHEVVLEKTPGRIISLVPSQTELLADLGLDREVAGITKFCIHPDSWFRNKLRVGGTKDFKTSLIKSLAPDLVLANKEENSKEKLEELQLTLPVYTSNIRNLEEAFEMIAAVGEMTDRKEAADELIRDCRKAFAALVPAVEKEKVLYLIWNRPWMCAGTDTFIHDMLLRCGFENGCTAERYPELSEEAIRRIHPSRILLSSEPFPFTEKHKSALQEMFPGTYIQLVDGEFFSWYGSRMKKAPNYFQQVISRSV